MYLSAYTTVSRNTISLQLVSVTPVILENNFGNYRCCKKELPERIIGRFKSIFSGPLFIMISCFYNFNLLLGMQVPIKFLRVKKCRMSTEIEKFLKSRQTMFYACFAETAACLYS